MVSKNTALTVVVFNSILIFSCFAYPFDDELRDSLYSQNQSFLITSNTIHEFFNDINTQKGALIQFYNDWCVHCKDFKHTWLKLTSKLRNKWQHIMEFGVTNCAKSSSICHAFNVSVTPTILLFPPNAIEVTSRDLNVTVYKKPSFIKKTNLLHDIINSVKRSEFSELCPELTMVNDSKVDRGFVFFITRDEENIDVLETVIDFCASRSYNISLIPVPRNKSGDLSRNHLYFKNTNSMEKVASFGQQPISSAHIKSIVFLFLNEKFNLTLEDYSTKSFPVNFKVDDEYSIESAEERSERSKIVNMVKQLSRLQKKDVIYLHDLKKTINYSITHDLSCIDSNRIKAAKSFLNYVYELLKLDSKEKIALEQEISYIENNRCELLDDKSVFDVGSTPWLGCISSLDGGNKIKREYTCGLWQLFHHFTVKAYIESSNDTNVLVMIKDYVKYFFGCEECQKHFLEMEAADSIDKVRSSKEAVLWLWRKHNIVNGRLHNQSKEDPKFVKIQFPSHTYCPECYNGTTSQWNTEHVIDYLVSIYRDPVKLTSDDVLRQIQEDKQYREKRNISKNDIVLTRFDLGLFLGVYMLSIALSIFIFNIFFGFRLKKMFTSS